MKKKLLSLVMLASAAAPLAAVVSCGGDIERKKHSKVIHHDLTEHKTDTETNTVSEPLTEQKEEIVNPVAPSEPASSGTPQGNFALNSIADYEAQGNAANLTAKNIQATNTEHFNIPFAGKVPTGFVAKASDVNPLNFLITWTKYNRSWKLDFLSTSLHYQELKIAELVEKIKNTREMNLSTIKNPSKEDKQLYMGYIFRRYMNEVWKEQYKNFSKLTTRFPFMSVSFKHYDKGAWDASLMHTNLLWNALRTEDEIKNNMSKAEVIARTALDVYEISIDGYVYRFMFDTDYALPKILQRKLITDVFTQKQWSHHILKCEGFLISPRNLGQGGVGNDTMGWMAPWSAYFNTPPGLSNNSIGYKNFHSFFTLEEGVFHEFGHNMTLSADHVGELVDGSFSSTLTKPYADIYADDDRYLHLAHTIGKKYMKYEVPMSEMYDSWESNPLFEDLLAVVPEGGFHEYNFSESGEYATELSRQFEESNMFENTNFFNGESEFTASEVTRYSSYFENWNHPIWDKNTRKITAEGKAYRDEFNKNIMGYSKENVVQFTGIESRVSNWKNRNGLVGSVKEDFDLIKLTDPNNPNVTCTSDKIIKLGRNHSNWFNKNRFLSRDNTLVQDGKIPFVMSALGRQDWYLVPYVKVEFFKDANSDGIADENEKVYETTVKYN